MDVGREHGLPCSKPLQKNRRYVRREVDLWPGMSGVKTPTPLIKRTEARGCSTSPKTTSQTTVLLALPHAAVVLRARDVYIESDRYRARG